MDKQREQAMEIARSFMVYQQSEQADLTDTEHPFDAMWQSICDVCQLAKHGIIDDVTEEEVDEAYAWLKTTQSLTEAYKDYDINF